MILDVTGWSIIPLMNSLSSNFSFLSASPFWYISAMTVARSTWKKCVNLRIKPYLYKQKITIIPCTNIQAIKFALSTLFFLSKLVSSKGKLAKITQLLKKVKVTLHLKIAITDSHFNKCFFFGKCSQGISLIFTVKMKYKMAAITPISGRDMTVKWGKCKFSSQGLLKNKNAFTTDNN